MKASLIIPTYNRGEVLCDTIVMALNQNVDSYEIIVIDQTPSYESKIQERLNLLIEGVRYYKLEQPSLPTARNLGICEAKGEIVIFIDDDVVIESDYIASHLRNFDDKRVGGVMGVTLTPQNTDIENYLFQAQVLFEISERVEAGGVYPVTWLLGGNVSYRRDALIKAGMFDEYYKGSGLCEDADMSVRVKALSYELLLDSQIKMIHLEVIAGGCENRNRTQIESRSIEQLIFYSYYGIKNRHILGNRRLVHILFRAYRNFALNREVIKAGFSILARKHLIYAKSVRRALLDALTINNSVISRYSDQFRERHKVKE